MPVINYYLVNMGCDPELFLAQDGNIVGAEKVIPEAGLKTGHGLWGKGDKPAIILDGVQVEFNPNPHTCRANLGNELQTTFRTLREHLKKIGSGKIEASFRSVVEVDQAELDSLSEKSRRLGCAPSNNHYDKAASISVDPSTYTKRSAGGHIHIDLRTLNWGVTNHLLKYREELVPIMDCLPGLVSVFCDRDPLAAERRQVYGRAGEYRLPSYGLEYRTLSNFWLRSYQLFSLMFGLTRFATSVLATKYVQYGGATWDAPKALLDNVDLGLVQAAINGNDLVLAKKAWQPVREFIKECMPAGHDFGIKAGQLTLLEHFFHRIEQHGIEYWFPQDPVEHWCNMPEGHTNTGSESFLAQHVAADKKPARVFGKTLGLSPARALTSEFNGPVYKARK